MEAGTSKSYGDVKWTGIEAYHAPHDMPPGTVAQADNLYVQSNRWFTRPGFQGQFTSKLGSSIYALTPITQIDGSTHIWFACNGNLYKFIPDGSHTAPTQIALAPASALTGSVSLSTIGTGYLINVSSTSGIVAGMTVLVTDGTHFLRGLVTVVLPGEITVTSTSQSGTSGTIATSGSSITIQLSTFDVVICQGGGYVYIADATATPMLRLGASGSIGVDGAPYLGLFQPQPPNPVTLSQENLLGAANTLTWGTEDLGTVANIIPAGDVGIYAGNSGGTNFWQTSSGGTFDYPSFDTPTTTLTGAVTLHATGTTYSIAVTDGSWITNGSQVTVNDGTNFLIGIVNSGGGTSTISVTSGSQSASSGSIGTSGSVVSYKGIRIISTGSSWIQNKTPLSLPSVTIGTVTYFPEVFQVTFFGQVQGTAQQYPTRMQVTMFAHDGSGTLLQEISNFIGPMPFSTIRDWTSTFDFRGTGVQKISIRFAAANDAYPFAEPILSNIRVIPGGWGFYEQAVGSSEQIQTGTVYASPPGDTCTGGSITTTTSASQPTQLYAKGHRFYIDTSGSPPDWSSASGIQRVVWNVNLSANFLPSGTTVPVRLYIENASGSAGRAYSAETILTPNQSTPVSFDLTVVDSAISSSVHKFGLEFSDDIPTSGYIGYWGTSPSASPVLMLVQSIENPGNLTVGLDLSYVLVEIDSQTDTVNLLNILQSNGSNFSTTITPTVTQAIGLLTLPSKTNPSSDFYALYRFGDFPDGLGRLVLLSPWATTSITAPPGAVQQPSVPPGAAIVFPANPYISLAGGIVTDNTPSSWLFSNTYTTPYVDGRITPPLYVRDIIYWQHRIWLIAGQISGSGITYRISGVWGSWLIPEDQNAGLYFSTTVSLTDPSGPIKGFYQPVGEQDNDIALRLLPISGYMTILMQRTPPYVMQGSGPSDWQIADFPLGGAQSTGLVGKHAASITSVPLNVRNVFIQPSASLVYLNPNGMYAYDDIREPREVSLNLRGLVAPQLLAGIPYNPAALAQASIWYHGSHFYAAMPSAPGDSVPTVILRYEEPDNEFGAVGGGQANGIWGRWSSPTFNPTIGCMVPSSSDNAGHYIGGSDGQLYLCVPNQGDIDHVGASQAGIPVVFQSRGYGYDLPMNVKTPISVEFDFEYQNTEPNLTLAISVTGRQQASWTQNYTLQENNTLSSAGNNIDHMYLDAGFASGEVLQVGFSGSPLGAFLVGALRFTTSIGGSRRR